MKGESDSGLFLILAVFVVPSSQTPASALAAQLRNEQDGSFLGVDGDSSAKHAILAPEIGYVHGVAGMYRATVDQPPSPSQQVELAFDGGTPRGGDGRGRGDHERGRAGRLGELTVPGVAGRRLDPDELHLGGAADVRLAVVALAALSLASAAVSSRAPRQTSPETTITFALRLRLDTARLDRDVAAGRHAASPAALGRRYGLPLGSIERVERVLGAHGIEVIGGYPQRTALDARATVGTLSRFFDVTYRDFPGFRRADRRPDHPGCAAPLRHGRRRAQHPAGGGRVRPPARHAPARRRRARLRRRSPARAGHRRQRADDRDPVALAVPAERPEDGRRRLDVPRQVRAEGPGPGRREGLRRRERRRLQRGRPRHRRRLRDRTRRADRELRGAVDARRGSSTSSTGSSRTGAPGSRRSRGVPAMPGCRPRIAAR